ncbi:MFS domain-containing protein [Fusarium keratoplasticum]|uniref:MFS domain-containing protein n=1 Tax=Fusarium keratoplasticum TaxID=1328300 RepID=A0ACC0QIK1_9HYPO|nr:MFS domain-containing protein [Fusarium keratoplasticum]KAI8654750.1 MFS domain-containing protein [Fusarium keratoplasticum]
MASSRMMASNDVQSPDSNALRLEENLEQAPSNADHAVSTNEFDIPKWKSIVMVISSFTIVFTCCGLNFAFGVYQALYEAMALKPDTPFTGASPAQIDLIGTLSISLMTMGAPFIVAWAKRFSPHRVSFVGGIVFGLSLILASFGTRLWHFTLSQGLLLGFGTCSSYMTAVTVAPTWFTTHRGLAMGIILSGTGVGGLVWAPALKACNDQIGFRNTLRLTGGVSSFLVTAASFSMAWEPRTRAQLQVVNAARVSRADGIFNVPLVDLRVAKSQRFLAQALSAIFQAAAYYTPVFFFASYAATLGYSTTAGANFIAISNACNAVGKIVIGHAADRIGRLNSLFMTTLLSAVVTLGFWLPSTLHGQASSSQNLFITFTIFYGIFASAYISLFPASLVELFGPQNFASVNGVLYMVRGMATMIGTPVGGVLIRTSSTNIGPKAYERMSILVGTLMCAATVAVLWVRLEAMVGTDGKRRWKWKL